MAGLAYQGGGMRQMLKNRLLSTILHVEMIESGINISRRPSNKWREKPEYKKTTYCTS